MSEATEQMKVVEWCKTTAWRLHGTTDYGVGLIFHIPNGGWRSKAEAAQLKAMGVRPGVSDLFLPIPSRGKHGLWIEMKRAGDSGACAGRIESAQDEWVSLMRERNYGAVFAFGAQEAIQAIKDYLGIGGV